MRILLSLMLALSCQTAPDKAVEDEIVVDNDLDGVPTGEDCDDANASVYPNAEEICNGIDDNCNGFVDDEDPLITDAQTWFADSDGDGYGNVQYMALACEQPEWYVENSIDCNDMSAAAYPDAEEICDEIDNDCDGDIDEDVQLTFYADSDGDGFGDAGLTSDACSVPPGHVDDSSDCNDADSTVYPGADDFCDQTDSDCDDDLRENDSVDALTWYADLDTDGFGDGSATIKACDQPHGYVSDDTDCNDIDSTIFPGATELCDFTDSDCDGLVDESDSIDASVWYADADGDTYGDATTSLVSCSQPQDYVIDSTDCNDASELTFPGALETADGTDENCDGVVDNGTTVFDDDGDGFSEDDGDCNDADSNVYEGAPELCDEIDSDCDGDLVDGEGDLDGDEIPDCVDTDLDGDGIDNAIDNCPDDANSGQFDYDQNGAGDACDVFYQCPMFGQSQNIICSPPFGINGGGCVCDCLGQVQNSPTCIRSTFMSIGHLTCNEAPEPCTPIVNNECLLYSSTNGSVIGTVPCDTL